MIFIPPNPLNVMIKAHKKSDWVKCHHLKTSSKQLLYCRHASNRDYLVQAHLYDMVNQMQETEMKVNLALLVISVDESDSHSAADDLPSKDDILNAF